MCHIKASIKELPEVKNFEQTCVQVSSLISLSKKRFELIQCNRGLGFQIEPNVMSCTRIQIIFLDRTKQKIRFYSEVTS